MSFTPNGRVTAFDNSVNSRKMNATHPKLRHEDGQIDNGFHKSGEVFIKRERPWTISICSQAKGEGASHKRQLTGLQEQYLIPSSSSRTVSRGRINQSRTSTLWHKSRWTKAPRHEAPLPQDQTPTFRKPELRFMTIR